MYLYFIILATSVYARTIEINCQKMNNGGITENRGYLVNLFFVEKLKV